MSALNSMPTACMIILCELQLKIGTAITIKGLCQRASKRRNIYQEKELKIDKIRLCCA